MLLNGKLNNYPYMEGTKHTHNFQNYSKLQRRKTNSSKLNQSKPTQSKNPIISQAQQKLVLYLIQWQHFVFVQPNIFIREIGEPVFFSFFPFFQPFIVFSSFSCSSLLLQWEPFQIFCFFLRAQNITKKRKNWCRPQQKNSGHQTHIERHNLQKVEYTLAKHKNVLLRADGGGGEKGNTDEQRQWRST